MVLTEVAVAMLVMVTAAPGTTAPELSVTVPTTPLDACAKPMDAAQERTAIAERGTQGKVPTFGRSDSSANLETALETRM